MLFDVSNILTNIRNNSIVALNLYKERLAKAKDIQSTATLKGHTYSVNALAILPDGRIVSGSGDNTLRLWDAKTSQCIVTLKGHTSYVGALAVFPDGRLVSGSNDNTLRLWDAKTSQCIAALTGHASYVSALAILPDGRIVSGSHDNTLRLWDAKTLQCIATLTGHTDYVSALAILPDGRIVSGSCDNTLRLWDAKTSQCIATLKGHTSAVYALAVLPDGRIVSSSHDNTLRLWDSKTSQCIAALTGHASYVSALAILPDGRIVSGSRDNTLRLWDAKTSQCIATLKGHTSTVYALAVLPDGRIVSGSGDNTLRLWEGGVPVLALADFIDLIAALKTNTSVKFLSFARSNLKLNQLQAISDLLIVNSTITRLDLSHNAINDTGAVLLIDALTANKSLIELNLSGNAIRYGYKKTIDDLLARNQKSAHNLLSAPAQLPPAKMEIPEHLVCPLTQQIMFDPVIAADGHTYEREAIQEWMTKNDSKNTQNMISKLASALANYAHLSADMPKSTSPMTNLAFEHNFLVPSHSIKGLISDFLDKHPVLRESDDYYFPNQSIQSVTQALIQSNAAVLKQLLQRDKRIAKRYYHNNESLLEAACRLGSLETLELILSALPVEVPNRLDDAAKACTFQTLIQTHGVEGARLWNKAFKWTSKEVTKIAVSIIAVGNIELLKSCLDIGAPLDYQDEQGQSFLHLAVLANQPALVHWLLEKGVNPASIDSQQRTALRLAIEAGHENMLPYLVKPEFMEQKDIDGYTAVLYAVQQQKVFAVEALLKADANIHATDNQGNTILHIAAKTGNAELIKLLLTNPVETKPINKEGRYPAQLAKAAGYANIAKQIEYSHRERKFAPYLKPLQEKIVEQAQCIKLLKEQITEQSQRIKLLEDQNSEQAQPTKLLEEHAKKQDETMQLLQANYTSLFTWLTESNLPARSEEKEKTANNLS